MDYRFNSVHRQRITILPHRGLVGHSLGGLTAIDILTKVPQLFNAYIAIDPSMW